MAPVIITTGGAGEDPSYSEGGVGHDYLMRRGVAERNLIAETLGTDTAHSAERLGVIMRTNGMKSCLTGERRVSRLPHQATARTRRHDRLRRAPHGITP